MVWTMSPCRLRTLHSPSMCFVVAAVFRRLYWASRPSQYLLKSLPVIDLVQPWVNGGSFACPILERCVRCQVRPAPECKPGF